MPQYNVTVNFQENKSLDKIEILISAPERSDQVESLLAQFAQKQQYLDLPTDGGRVFRVRTDSIIRIYSQNRKNYVCVSDETIRTSASVNSIFPLWANSRSSWRKTRQYLPPGAIFP